MLEPALQAKLDKLPSAPGVYIFRGRDGSVLYVGKASSLRSRVRSYFQDSSSDPRFFIGRLPQELGDLETIVTATEKEAALLENSLIKEHQPRYNFKLRDDKDFLSLRLDPQAPWPRLEVVRRPKKDGALYFGPYHSATAARSTLRTVNRYFKLRTCTDSEMRGRSRPCLQYQIKRCPGPCVLEVDREEYAVQVRNVALFLEDRHDELVKHLDKQMRSAAQAEAFEVAAMYRDQLHSVETVRERQRVSLVTDLDQDVVGYFRDGTRAELAMLLVRRGKVVGVRTYGLREIRVPDDELVASFVREYYARTSFTPHEILLPIQVEAMQGLEEMLSERGTRTRLVRPQRGPKAKLVRMAMENAVHAYQANARAEEDTAAQLAEVAEKLGLERLPHRIECVDVSHTAGQDTVAAVVALRDGKPDRKRYRSFHLRRVAGGDDYGAMHEVLSRRLSRARQGRPEWELPDLLVVDGGKGQLNVALGVLRDLGIEVPVAALAKEKERPDSEKVVDRVFVPNRLNPISLMQGQGRALQMLALARDEAHRVSNALRLKLGKRRQLRSGLDAVAGIGPKTRSKLLRQLGSLSAIQQADLETLLAAGASRSQALAIRRAFHGATAESDPTGRPTTESSPPDDERISKRVQ